MASNKDLPKWATIERRQHLIELFIRSKGFCVFGHSKCPYPSHHYGNFIEDLITDWKLADIEQRSYEYLIESISLHSLCESKYPLRGTFSAIARDIYASNQPLFYIQGMGISGITLTPFAKVRLASSYLNLFVDLKDTLRGVSKNKRRKAVRYGKPLPASIEESISAKVREAVKHFLAH